MGCRGLGLAVFAIVCVLVWQPAPARAQSAAALALAHGGSAAALEVAPQLERIAHFRRKQSYYCYPKNYWWFYRPYTTAQEGYARCMPYFHYLDPPYATRGGRSDRYVK